ncbi:Extracellular exo-alpha-L-arabinofuranosidase precursor [compost metagenome]
MNSAKALEVPGGSTTDGTIVKIWTDNKTTSQQWIIKEYADGICTFMNVNSNKMLEVRGGGTTDGVPVQIWTDNATTSQRWKLVKVRD